MSAKLGRYATWRKAPGGHWVVFGRHDTLARAHADGLPVQVRRTDDQIQAVYLEHVGTPNWEGWACAHPYGTVTGEFAEPEQIPTIRVRRARNRVRRHGQSQTNQRKRDRMR